MAKGKPPAKDTSTATIGFEAKLWLAADKLRNNMDAAEYSRAERDRSPKATRRAGAGAPVNHVVLGLIFLKYISDTAGKCRMANANVRTRNARPLRHSKFVVRHFPPPPDARWPHLQASAQQPERKAEVRMPKEEPRLQLPTSSFPLPTWPDAMVAIERDWQMATAEARMWN